ncbi:thyrotropin-releasing hormone-degrading ectoenzyme-like isoform X2 [Odontomachus brunneus]|uniref:thyrotropin-releasing hormone-degrading ectoenzyme-like isoform X2 n=1 Tax=Odontomachus brunneus TaxID=486640 RepID=UPI0013F20F4E|nr:thyrotropin-releasing hormone-degrading ectoenzyme-like isoform X2 [Odontomachus brunneus]
MIETRVDVMFFKLLLNTCLIFTTVIAKRILHTTIDTNVDTGNCSQHKQKKQERQNRGRKLRTFVYCMKTQILILEFDRSIHIGIYELHMKFNGSLLGPKGLVAINRTIDRGETRQSYVTLFEPTGARRVFPCWDDRSRGSTYNISIAHSNTLRAWSNMPVMKKSYVTYNRIQTHFEISPYMPVCYLTILVSDVEIAYTHWKYPIQSNINMWCVPNTRNQLKMTEEIAPIIDYFIVKNMSFIWKGSVINFIVLPNLPTNFLGNWGVAIVRQEYIIDKGISAGHQIEVQKRIAHAIIRHYIETFNTYITWFSEWFRKGLTLYLSYDIIAESQLYAKMGDLFVVQVVQPALHNDIVFNVPHITNEYDPIYFSFIINKASIIIRMMKHILTKEVFNQAMANYFNLNDLNSPHDLWNLLKIELFTNEDPNRAEELIFSWLSQPNYPILYLVEYKDGHGKYIKQNASMKTVNVLKLWVIPVTYTTQTELNFLDTSPKLWYTGGNHELPQLDPYDWIIFNIQQTGFYRVHYDNDNWFKLARYLNEEDHTMIHYLNRAQLIDDAYYFMMKLEMNYNIFYYLINYLWKEQEYTPWHTITNILHYMSPFFNFPESLAFKNHILNILVKHLNQQFNNKRVIATQLLIQYWACKFGNRRSRESIKNNLIHHIMHLNDNTIRPGWEDLTYCAGLMTADSSVWNIVATDFIARNQTSKLKHLTCTDNNVVINEFMKSITSKISDKWAKLEPKHLLTLYHSMMKKHARKKEVFDFFLANFHKILPNYLSIIEKFGSIIMNVYSTCQFFKIWTVVNWNYNANFIIIDAVELMISWRKKELQRQMNMFRDPFNITHYEDIC